ncbi:DUF1761 domain-containing protein [Saprospiraceae bacterium]|nr:DUF1761 domain-containing protein [Saprospiraceae bacterium]
MPTNFYMLFVSALIPLIIGAIYYNPKVVGSAWMKTNGFTDKDLEGANMPLIFGLTFVFGIFISLMFSFIVIHQTATFSMLMPNIMESGSAEMIAFNDLMTQYGGNFRTFGHGAGHGVMFTVLFVLPLIAINALFERRGWKYIFIHTGFWLINLALMGGLLCATLVYPVLQ